MDILGSSEWQNKRIQFVIRESHSVENVGDEQQRREAGGRQIICIFPL